MCVNKTDRNIYYTLQENFDDTKEQNGRNTENTLTKKTKGTKEQTMIYKTRVLRKDKQFLLHFYITTLAVLCCNTAVLSAHF
jgi:hypothetical protein